MIDESKIVVTDNFLPQEQFERLQEYIMSNRMAWYTCGRDQPGGYPLMQHIFWSDTKGPEQYPDVPMLHLGYNYIRPITNRIPIAAMIRCRANLSWYTSTQERRKYHTDTIFDCTTAVFYVHDSDGCTVFDNPGDEELEVESVANRLVEFPSSYEHSSTPFTTTDRRIVINFNYIKQPPLPANKPTINPLSNPEHW